MTLIEFLSAMGNLGAASGPIFAVLYWLERVDNKELRGKNEALAERVLVLLTKAEATFTTMVSILNSTPQGKK